MQVAGSAMKRTGATPLSEVMRMKAVGPYLFPGHPDVAASPFPTCFAKNIHYLNSSHQDKFCHIFWLLPPV